MSYRHLLLAIASAAIGLVGCGPSKEELAAKEQAAKAEIAARVERELIANLQNKVANKMFDPASAQFRHVKLVRNKKGLCGEVNARNKFGGYVGFRVFMWVPEENDAWLLHAGMTVEQVRRFAADFSGVSSQEDFSKKVVDLKLDLPDRQVALNTMKDLAAIWKMSNWGWNEC